jgi:hypothetical protein
MIIKGKNANNNTFTIFDLQLFGCCHGGYCTKTPELP